MVTRDFSGNDVVKVLVNVGGFAWKRTSGDHVILKWSPPESHDTEPRTVTVPRHDRLDTGTLRSIAEQAGAEDFRAFCEWVDRNR
ncbi:type II toxin-antitoxin system HicA family toxin [Halobacterium noricense]|uniref:type II toxin-antitoxin system HicA family toxin n=1 Tax=Halobacterium noricense TaxID=223182 RepID=UPI001E40804E|nr:type II toxin-antitoxin system HicA family toxin [Halobacterium noricense]UHH25558.1 type II toxin-antitoxin system HicA family toxin [Halobacterium noricense]